MGRRRRGQPPAKAYSRVTNPERYAVLHDHALRLLRDLESRFDVERVEGYDIDPDLEPPEPARPTVRLEPIDPGAAPVTIAFTRFPGLVVRRGTEHIRSYPVCGCDGCDESPEELLAYLDEQVGAAVSGTFREHPPFGQPVRGRRLHRVVGVRRALVRPHAPPPRAQEVRVWRPWPER